MAFENTASNLIFFLQISKSQLWTTYAVLQCWVSKYKTGTMLYVSDPLARARRSPLMQNYHTVYIRSSYASSWCFQRGPLQIKRRLNRWIIYFEKLLQYLVLIRTLMLNAMIELLRQFKYDGDKRCRRRACVFLRCWVPYKQGDIIFVGSARITRVLRL